MTPVSSSTHLRLCALRFVRRLSASGKQWDDYVGQMPVEVGAGGGCCWRRGGRGDGGSNSSNDSDGSGADAVAGGGGGGGGERVGGACRVATVVSSRNHEWTQPHAAGATRGGFFNFTNISPNGITIRKTYRECYSRSALRGSSLEMETSWKIMIIRASVFKITRRIKCQISFNV